MAQFAHANSVVAARVRGPLLIVQSVGDTLVAPQLSLDFARWLCAVGRRVPTPA